MSDQPKSEPMPVRIRIEHLAFIESVRYRRLVFMAAKRVIGRGDVLSAQWLHKCFPKQTPRCCAAEPVELSRQRVLDWLDQDGVPAATLPAPSVAR